MKTARTLCALPAVMALLAIALPAHADTDPFAPYPVTVKKSGLDKETTYLQARGELLDACDRDRGFIEKAEFQFLEGWGAAHGRHFVIANGTCRVHP